MKAPPPFPWLFPYTEEPVNRGYPPDQDFILRPVLEIRFADVVLRLGRYGSPDQFVEWRAEVGFMHEWEPPWPAVLGQRGFLDQFTVTMSRLSQAIAIEHTSAFDDRFGPVMEERHGDWPSRFTP